MAHKQCSRCRKWKPVTRSRYCNKCKAAKMREWRKTHPLKPEERKRSNARRHANMARQRGQIQRERCVMCKSERSQMHHPDYRRPKYVVWFCRPCHLFIHKFHEAIK